MDIHGRRRPRGASPVYYFLATGGQPAPPRPSGYAGDWGTTMDEQTMQELATCRVEGALLRACHICNLLPASKDVHWVANGTRMIAMSKRWGDVAHIDVDAVYTADEWQAIYGRLATLHEVTDLTARIAAHATSGDCARVCPVDIVVNLAAGYPVATVTLQAVHCALGYYAVVSNKGRKSGKTLHGLERDLGESLSLAAGYELFVY